MYVSGSASRILYGLPKIHKPDFVGLFQLRPMFASHISLSFETSKHLTKIIAPPTVNECTVENSQQLSISVANNPKTDSCYMVSIGDDFLFTNVPLSETISIKPNHFFSQSDTFMNITCVVFKSCSNSQSRVLFSFLMVNFTSKLKVWIWVCAKNFMCLNGIIWLSHYPASFKPLFL